MTTPIAHALLWSVAVLTIGFLATSSIIFVLEVAVGGIHPSDAIADIVNRQFAEGHNLFSLAVIGLMPFVVLSIANFLISRNRTPLQYACVVLCGLIGILALMIPAHVSIWYPLYGPGHASSTAVIGFLFIPFYCLVSLAIGLVVGRHIAELPYFSGAHKKRRLTTRSRPTR
jgi:hypothetical protein